MSRTKPGPPSVVDFDVEWLLAIANQHADSEADHTAEISDIQSFLRLAWRQLSGAQCVAFMASEKVRDVVENAGAEWSPPAGPARSAVHIDWLIKVAQAHGEDDLPDHENGDLQDLLRGMWSLMSIDQQRALLALEEFNELLERAGSEPMATDAEAILSDEWDSVLEHFGLDDSFRYEPQQVLDYVNAYRLFVDIENPGFHRVELHKRGRQGVTS